MSDRLTLKDLKRWETYRASDGHPSTRVVDVTLADLVEVIESEGGFMLGDDVGTRLLPAKGRYLVLEFTS